jgi:alpha-ketoglutarate-dependent taurine dioxygenase
LKSNTQNRYFLNEIDYQLWRKARLDSYPTSADDLRVEIGGLLDLSADQRKEILLGCQRSNMAIYSCRDKFSDRAAVKAFAASFGLSHLDYHLCVNDDGVSELTSTTEGTRGGYVPYSNRSLSWHTDGYYNKESEQIRAVVLHCESAAEAGGENALLDAEIAYILLRDLDPRYITAFEHPECMTIPANIGVEGEIRPEACGPVFSYDGRIHMRFSARKKNIKWRDDELTREARQALAEILADVNGPVLRYRLRAGEGLISNNVLHNRTSFEDGTQQKRLLYRARFYDRIESS